METTQRTIIANSAGCAVDQRTTATRRERGPSAGPVFSLRTGLECWLGAPDRVSSDNRLHGRGANVNTKQEKETGPPVRSLCTQNSSGTRCGHDLCRPAAHREPFRSERRHRRRNLFVTCTRVLRIRRDSVTKKLRTTRCRGMRPAL